MTQTSNPFDAWADLMLLWERFSDTADIDFYRRLAERQGGPSVELGIGYGRVAEQIHPDYGVDLSARMIELAAQRLPRTQLFQSDLASFELPGAVRLAYAPLNTFDGVIADDDVRAALRRTWEQSEPGGLLAFDGAIPDLERSLRENGRVDLGVADETIAIQTAEQVVDRETGELRVTAVVDELGEGGWVTRRRWFPPMPYRARTPAQWAALLEETGWEVLERWGGFEGEPLDPDGGGQVWVARRP